MGDNRLHAVGRCTRMTPKAGLGVVAVKVGAGEETSMRGRALIAVVGFGASAVLAAAAPSQGAEPKPAPLVGPAVQVTPEIDPSRAYNQPQVAIDPKDPQTIAVIGANYNAGTCGVHVSLDGGRTWRAGQGVAKPA